MNLARRVAKLERIKTDNELPRIVLRFEGPGSENMAQPTQNELDGNTEIVTICLVE
jgi:hypothetical protein